MNRVRLDFIAGGSLLEVRAELAVRAEERVPGRLRAAAPRAKVVGRGLHGRRAVERPAGLERERCVVVLRGRDFTIRTMNLSVEC